MRTVLQRVLEASVMVEGVCTGKVGQGLLVLAGFELGDTEEELLWMARKIVQQRIFSDAQGKMNLSVMDVSGEILVISQFTLLASTRKGNRPSFVRSAPPEESQPLYERFVSVLSEELGSQVQTGRFGADMKVQLCNDGPVTIYMDTRNKE
jgi:D-tyrosyl-tRNA(Tyr) deacylase